MLYNLFYQNNPFNSGTLLKLLLKNNIIFMLLNFYCYILFFPLILISNMLIFISNSWFSFWMIMEFNLISFTSFLMFDKNLKINILMNYLIIQSFNSYVYLIFCLLIYLFNLELFYLMMYLSIMIKLGFPPFYLWYLKIMKNLNWMNLFLMSTIQKLIPLLILNSILFKKMIYKINTMYLIYIIIYSSFKGFMFMNLKILMSYSSIIQISWIIILMLNNEKLMMSYFMIYLIINLNLSMMFLILNINHLNNLMLIKTKNKNFYFLFLMLMFSLSGIPPFLGFLIKWISIQFISISMNFFMMLMLIFSSLMSMMFYMRIMYFSLMFYFMNIKMKYKFINFNLNLNLNLIFINWMTISMLMIYELI